MTTTDRRFELAGEAACLLEDMGFVAVARKRDGVVTVELWKVVGGSQRSLSEVLTELEEPMELARRMAAEFEASLRGG